MKKSEAQFIGELARRGARERLAELDANYRHERQRLLNVIGDTVEGELHEMREEAAPKLHWTQRPENKAKLRAMHRKGRRTRNRAARA